MIIFAGCASRVPYEADPGRFLELVVSAGARPSVVDSQKCSECDGRGWIGDGATRLACTACQIGVRDYAQGE